MKRRVVITGMGLVYTAGCVGVDYVTWKRLIAGRLGSPSEITKFDTSRI